MSDLEPHREDQSQAPSPPTVSDPWSIWFSRLVQAAGLGIMGHEAFSRHADRPWLMLFASAMMLGGVGLTLILRWVAARVPE